MFKRPARHLSKNAHPNQNPDLNSSAHPNQNPDLNSSAHPNQNPDLNSSAQTGIDICEYSYSSNHNFQIPSTQDDDPPEPEQDQLLFYAIDIMMKGLGLSYFDISTNSLFKEPFKFNLNMQWTKNDLLKYFEKCLELYKIEYILDTEKTRELNPKYILTENGKSVNISPHEVRYALKACIYTKEIQKSPFIYEKIIFLSYIKGDFWILIRILGSQLYITNEDKDPSKVTQNFIGLYASI